MFSVRPYLTAAQACTLFADPSIVFAGRDALLALWGGVWVMCLHSATRMYEHRPSFGLKVINVVPPNAGVHEFATYNRRKFC